MAKTKKVPTRKDKKPADGEISLEQLIEIIANNTKVHIGDVALVFDELYDVVIKTVSKNKKIYFGIGNLKLREYGWKNFNTGLLFTPTKKMIHEIRSKIDPNYKDDEKETNE